MNDKDQAKLLRWLARSASRQAVTFLDEADRLDPPGRPGTRYVCDVCGDAAPSWTRAGKRCLSYAVEQLGPLCKSTVRCTGTYRPDETRARAAEAAASVLPEPIRPLKPILAKCDNCGRTVTQPGHVGLMCGDYLTPGGYCHGTMREYRPEPVRLKDGPTLPVSVDDLAYQQAVRDFVCGDDEAFNDLDIASTYRGAR